MELIRKPIHYTQEGKSLFDQFYLDEESGRWKIM